MKTIAIVGGGAAGFFAAITCAEVNPRQRVVLLDKSSRFLGKVRISGGGRCNVTHACFEPRTFTHHYPRGSRALISPFHRFGMVETIEWFKRRGVRLKTEADGRVFPVTDSSQTVIDCLMHAASAAGVELSTRSGVETIMRDKGGFTLRLSASGDLKCDRVLLATGGARDARGAILAEACGHTIEPAVPSLFSFEAKDSGLRALAGVSVPLVEATVSGTKLRERGALLFTHRGLSGPVILRFSAWGARDLHARNYQFDLRLNWLPNAKGENLAEEIAGQRRSHPTRLVSNSAVGNLPARLWESLTERSGIAPETRWTELTRRATLELLRTLGGTTIGIDGQSLNKDEFVTCGGVRLREVNFKTMESRCCPNLFFAGELLDIDGITGGFNFQSAWTTGWIAGHAMAANEP